MSCQHVEEYKKKKAFLKNLRRIHENFIIKKKNTKNVLPIKCFDCNKYYNRLHICLSCVYIGCYNDRRHIHQHINLTSHNFVMDLEYGVMYCSKCSDYIYDPINEKYLLDAYLNHGYSIDSIKLFNPWIPDNNDINLLKNFSIGLNNNFYIDESPTDSIFKKQRISNERICSININPRGLKGLINLGNTCFMNCILQALIHVPILKRYFLNDLHVCKMEETSLCLLCELGLIYQDFFTTNYGISNTLADEMSQNEVMGVDNGVNDSAFAHAPSKFLHLVWTNAKHLSGYEQKDAHEFFIAALDVLHKHAQGIKVEVSNNLERNSHLQNNCNYINNQIISEIGEEFNGNPNGNIIKHCGKGKILDMPVGNKGELGWHINGKIDKCDCVIDQIFTGYLQSDVTCKFCKHVSTTVDPYWDISLDLNGSRGEDMTSQAYSTFKNGETIDHGYHTSSRVNHLVQPGSGGALSLEKCLERFTCRENLGSHSKIRCSNCKTYQESTKQLTIRKLPIVACFHLKRFEQQNHNNQGPSAAASIPNNASSSSSSRRHFTKNRKLTQYVSFPEELDMTPFLADKKKDSNVLRGKTSNNPNVNTTDKGANKYSLFAVVNHIGNINSGHYASYVKNFPLATVMEIPPQLNRHPATSLPSINLEHDTFNMLTPCTGQWFWCNDHNITPADIGDVLKSEGYLLFYQKQYHHYEHDNN